MFLASKSRLVSLSQKPSMPRLELQAAVIATKLKNTIVNEIPSEFLPLYAYLKIHHSKKKSIT